MEGAPAKPKGRKPGPKKAEGAGAAGRAGSVVVAAAAPAAAARPTATEATATEQTELDEATQPQPTLSQRLAKSLKQLSQLGSGSKAEVRLCCRHSASRQRPPLWHGGQLTGHPSAFFCRSTAALLDSCQSPDGMPIYLICTSVPATAASP